MEKETHRFVCQAGRSNVGRCEAADLRAGAYSVKKWLTLLGNFELVMVAEQMSYGSTIGNIHLQALIQFRSSCLTWSIARLHGLRAGLP